ncbi:sensor histidine kinase [Micromonospora sp. NPDC000663]|uniref:sensor histidine kinase n=1 Tax=Micromonospora sp. NPDC000663 TaxID=3364218 RepID=UPI00369783FB
MRARQRWDQVRGLPVVSRLRSRLRSWWRLLAPLGPLVAWVSAKLDSSRQRVSLPGVDGSRRPMLAWLLWWLITGLLTLAALPLNVALAAVKFSVHPLVAFVAGIGQSTALILILVRPRAATVLQFLSVAVIAVAIPPDARSTWPLTVPGLLTLIAHIGLVAARETRRVALLTWWASTVLLTVLVVLDPRGRSVMNGLTILLLYPILAALVLGAVLIIRHWGQLRRELADARHDVEAQQTSLAVAEERTRIARELHDVVAHSMSVIHMQATSASYRLQNLEPETKDEFARIATGARSAMQEMRRLLAVLRDESSDADLAPVPGLSRLPELVDSARRAGLPVELREADAVRAARLSEGVSLAAFRIVQESLSNVIRHAPGARTIICLDLAGLDLVLTVINDAAARHAESMEASGRAGHGVHGMRERVRLAGGALEIGARPEGGYRMMARLPIEGSG